MRHQAEIQSVIPEEDRLDWQPFDRRYQKAWPTSGTAFSLGARFAAKLEAFRLTFDAMTPDGMRRRIELG